MPDPVEDGLDESDIGQERQYGKFQLQFIALFSTLSERLGISRAEVMIEVGRLVRQYSTLRIETIINNADEFVKIAESTLGVALDSRDIINAYLNKRQFTSVSQVGELNFWDRIQKHQKYTLGNINVDIQIGFSRGKNLQQMGKTIMRHFSAFDGRLKNLTTDTLHKVYLNAMEKGLQKRAVDAFIKNDLVLTYHTQRDERVRPAHSAMEGTQYTETELRINGLPNELYDINCRCSLR